MVRVCVGGGGLWLNCVTGGAVVLWRMMHQGGAGDGGVVVRFALGRPFGRSWSHQHRVALRPGEESKVKSQK